MLTPEQINTEKQTFFGWIDSFISDDERRSFLIDYYTQLDSVLVSAPNSFKTDVPGCYAGGYLQHVNQLVRNAMNMRHIWGKTKQPESISVESVTFCALNCNLGRLHEDGIPYYIPNTEDWQKNKGVLYKINPDINYMRPADRAIYNLQLAGINMKNTEEFLGILLYNGLYDERNGAYFKNYTPDLKLKTMIPYILSQASELTSF